LVVDDIDPDLARLHKLQQRPALFTPGEALFWDDRQISEQMLTAHLDPKSDAADRRSSMARSRGSSRNRDWMRVPHFSTWDAVQASTPPSWLSMDST